MILLILRCFATVKILRYLDIIQQKIYIDLSIYQPNFLNKVRLI